MAITLSYVVGSRLVGTFYRKFSIEVGSFNFIQSLTGTLQSECLRNGEEYFIPLAIYIRNFYKS
ncbi:hypothetical protein D1013_06540 [Euzebyella marina]|uniref:Uncharacterized protein n=1 Tax=Euzebyella marina TaxID=1761453 RepID=A0A3G2L452_9FLAO|nr:hypothetical protein D1013_06540 [Euzebyella marina]